jgi:hypothetical protein
MLELLESRIAPANFIVTSSSSSSLQNRSGILPLYRIAKSGRMPLLLCWSF